ncbi:MAG: LysR family transcriptional regulator [Oscillospiraceae bacterium]|nr:LysR family transcriptional regulator [Oscillospiraceae bacterium]
MTNNQIKYMIEVAQTGSVNQAARNLFLSQSALSNAIMSVEEEFGHKIFNRSNKGVTLTSFGKLFIAYITPINRQLNQLYSMRGNASAVNLPTFTVISNGFYYLSDIAAALGRRYQATGIRISLMEDYGGNMFEAISNHTASLGVVRLWSCYRNTSLEQYAAMRLLYHPVAVMHVGVDVSDKNPLYRYEGKDILPEQLTPYPMILHESLDCGPYSDILYRLNLPAPRTRFVVDSRAAMYELLDTTDGYVLNSRNLNASKTPYVDSHNHRWRFIPFRECAVESEIGWLLPENEVLSQVGKEFVSMLNDCLLHDITLDY